MLLEYVLFMMFDFFLEIFCEGYFEMGDGMCGNCVGFEFW